MSVSGSGLEAVQAAAERYAHDHHCPSITWGLVVDGQLAHTGEVGTVDGSAPTDDTVYRIASMTKSFTCAAILTLRDEGALSLDDPITLHAPELAVVALASGGPIRIRHLMSMASGIATDDAWADRHLDITDDELDLAIAGGVFFAAAPGTVWEYSNLGFGLLGRVVKRATGRRVQDVVSERLLGPLGLTSTTWLQPEHPGWARPHVSWEGESAEPDPVAPLGDGEIAPMGGLWTTVADLARWVTFLDSDAPGPLSLASRREMQEMQRYAGMRDIAGHAAPTGYGFGLVVRHDADLGRTVAHSGGLPGYGSNMRWIAGRGLGIVALANVTYAPMSGFTYEALRILWDNGDVPAASRPDAPLVDALGRRLVRLLADWSDDEADALFTDNVALDLPYDRRRAAGERLMVSCGGLLEIVDVVADSATSGMVELAHPSGVPVRIDLQVAPVLPPRIQLYGLPD
ncbi:MAG: serine hydrolase domain-containing protein [Ilumatobacteraceae bacterium]